MFSPDVHLNETAVFSVSCMSGYQSLLGKGSVNSFLERSVAIYQIRCSETVWESVQREALQKDGRKGNCDCRGISVSELHCNLWLCWNHMTNWWWRKQRAAEAGTTRKLGMKGLEKYINLLSLHRLRSDMFAWAAAVLLVMCSGTHFSQRKSA